METKELMIGDLVKSRTQMIVKIMGLSCDAPCKYESIPLIPEILEKNGFVFNPIYKTYEFHRCGIHIELAREGEIMIGLSISVTDNEGFGGNVDIDKGKVIYIHELQHALRLCGLKELADNFIV